jgi:hypothetical protein
MRNRTPIPIPKLQVSRVLEELAPCQRKAIETVQRRAARTRVSAYPEIMRVLEREGQTETHYKNAVASVRAAARIALHFHPERLDRNGKSVAESLLSGGVYRNQFETGLSSGSPSAFPGGERDIWENRLFGGAYHGTEVLSSGRPKYGALDVMHHPDGPAPRFGSCYFLLRPGVAGRSTFTFGGSHEDCALDRTGTLGTFDSVMAPLLAQLQQGHGAFGVDDLTVARYLDQLAYSFSEPLADPRVRPLGRALDSFIEVQVHGDIRLDKDMERLVCDPAFEGHPLGSVLAAISTKYEVPLFWHPGFTLPTSEVPDVFRDYPVRPLAQRIAGRGMLDAANIGAAANSVKVEAAAWKGWASDDDIRTQFRRLWHVLVLNGAPRGR